MQLVEEVCVLIIRVLLDPLGIIAHFFLNSCQSKHRKSFLEFLIVHSILFNHLPEGLVLARGSLSLRLIFYVGKEQLRTISTFGYRMTVHFLPD